MRAPIATSLALASHSYVNHVEISGGLEALPRLMLSRVVNSVSPIGLVF
jgi:hypothetical protein